MTLGDKLAKLRKENNYTQEQLADILGVSRQAISKWESGTSYPETEKLIKLGELYDCSMDYLLKDSHETPVKDLKAVTININNLYFERKSKRVIRGLPLWHINIGFGRTAKGIIAVGLVAKGVISLGIVSVGILSLGLISLGIIALGEIALGILSAGAISAGIIAFGLISLGIVAVGALSVGDFAVGVLAIGNHFAMGDNAKAMIALGNTEATGSVYQKLGELTEQEITYIKELLDKNVPFYLSWAKELIKLFLPFYNN